MSSLSLVELFEAERETHVKALASDIHLITEHGVDQKIIQRMFRSAHSLK